MGQKQSTTVNVVTLEERFKEEFLKFKIWLDQHTVIEGQYIYLNQKLYAVYNSFINNQKDINFSQSIIDLIQSLQDCRRGECSAYLNAIDFLCAALLINAVYVNQNKLINFNFQQPNKSID